jgi:tetratricopeptide (TPR) repeat protein
MKKNLFKILLFSGAVATTLTACKKTYLQPDPLSFYEPDATFNTKSGLDAAMATCDRHLRSYWTYFSYQDLGLPISTEYMFSDVAVASKTDDGNIFADIGTRLTPTDMPERVGYFWGETYNGIKYANTILSYIDAVTELDDATKKAYIGRAYFHRAYRYMMLAFQFKDVPLVTKILRNPKVNYKSTKREAILKMITADMEKAVEYVPEQKNMTLVGLINKGSCRQLLIKCYLATGQFDKAIEQADILINSSGFSLMSANFGTFVNPYPQTWPITRNVIWDLHRPENKSIAANKEVILMMPNRNATESSVKMNSMRNWCPFLDNIATTSPDGKQAVRYFAATASTYRINFDYVRGIGRGIAHIRPTYYATNEVWFLNGVNDATDLRHSSTTGNWARMDSLHYNDPSSAAWFSKNLSLRDATNKLLCADTIRSWFDWPHYKYYIEDAKETGSPTEVNHRGGAGDLYCYRLAETYLLRAEAKFYKGDITGATADVNAVRTRAGCTQKYAAVTIGSIMDERARELNMEEWRFTELSRVSLSLALSGKPDEFGNTYNASTLETNSYWYNRVNFYNNYYNKNKVSVRNRSYTIDKRNINWPIPQGAIDANGGNKLRQNAGYPGFDPATPMWETWEDAVKDEDTQ